MCAHIRARFILPSQFFSEIESEPMLTAMKKSPLPEAYRTVEPATLQNAGQRAQHTTDCTTQTPKMKHKHAITIMQARRIMIYIISPAFLGDVFFHRIGSVDAV